MITKQHRLDFIFKLAFALLLIIPLSGCSHLYNAQNDQAAKKAHDAFVNAKLSEMVDQEYDLNKRTMEYQLKVIRMNSIALRDAVLVQIIDRHDGVDSKTRHKATWKYLDDQINDRLRGLGAVKDDDNIIPLKSYMSQIGTYRHQMEAFAVSGKASSDPRYIKFAQEQYSTAKFRMTKTRTALNGELSHSNEPTGVIPALWRKISSLEQVKNQIKSDVEEWGKKYKSIKDKYEEQKSSYEAKEADIEIMKILSSSDAILQSYKNWKGAPDSDKDKYKKAIDSAVEGYNSTVEKVKTKSCQKLIKELDGITKLPDGGDEAVKKYEKVEEDYYSDQSKHGNPIAFSWLAAKYLSEGLTKSEDSNVKEIVQDLNLEKVLAQLKEKLNALHQIVASWSSNGGSQPSNNAATDNSNTIVASTVKSLYEHFYKLDTQPPLGSLLLEVQRINIEIDAAKKRLSMAQLYEDLLNNQLQAYIQEVDSLDISNQLIRSKTHNWLNGKQSLIEDYEKGDIAKQREISKILTHYANSWTSGRIIGDEIDYKLIGLDHESAIDSTRFAILQWNNLILVPITSLSNYYSSGLKPETIAQLLQAAGLGAIAAQVK